MLQLSDIFWVSVVKGIVNLFNRKESLASYCTTLSFWVFFFGPILKSMFLNSGFTPMISHLLCLSFACLLSGYFLSYSWSVLNLREPINVIFQTYLLASFLLGSANQNPDERLENQKESESLPSVLCSHNIFARWCVLSGSRSCC